MIGTGPAGIPNLMALNSSPAIEVLAYRGLDPLQIFILPPCPVSRRAISLLSSHIPSPGNNAVILRQAVATHAFILR